MAECLGILGRLTISETFCIASKICLSLLIFSAVCVHIPVFSEAVIALCCNSRWLLLLYHLQLSCFFSHFFEICTFKLNTGTGKGGTSIWGKKFEDEFHESLRVCILCSCTGSSACIVVAVIYAFHLYNYLHGQREQFSQHKVFA